MKKRTEEELDKVVTNIFGEDKCDILNIDIQNFDLCDCPYQINKFIIDHSIKRKQIISFSRSDKYLTMLYESY